MEFTPEKKKFLIIACSVGALIGCVWACFVPLPGAPKLTAGIAPVMSYSYSTFSYIFMAGLGGAILAAMLVFFVFFISSQD
ncbi:MAG: hypothetical protein U0105_16890 [Candidatus Obscuribacterales bacterium]